MELSKASVHDIHYQNEVKHSGIANCTLFADKGFISKTYQLDLFNTGQIRLETPLRSNQHDKEHFPFIFKILANVLNPFSLRFGIRKC